MLPDVSTDRMTFGIGALYAVPAGYETRLRGAADSVGAHIAAIRMTRAFRCGYWLIRIARLQRNYG